MVERENDATKSKVIHVPAYVIQLPKTSTYTIPKTSLIFKFQNHNHQSLPYTRLSRFMPTAMDSTPLLNDAEAASEAASLLAENGDYVAVRGWKAMRKMFWIETVRIWEIALPITFNILCQFAVNSITNIFVGHLGDIELSAVSISLSVIGTFSFGFMVSSIFTVTVSLFLFFLFAS